MPGLIMWVAIAAAAALIWPRLREWASTTLADALGRVFGPTAKSVFLQLVAAADQAVSLIRDAAVAQVWRTIQHGILKAAVSIERKATNHYIKRLIGYLRRTFEAGPEKIYRVLVEEQVPYEDLPPKIREQLVYGQRQVEIPEVLTLRIRQ